MSISTYAELQTAVANWLHRSDLSTYIPEFIAIAESRIGRRLRVRDMETDASVSLVAGTRTASLPTSFKEVRRFYLNTSPIRELEYLTPQDYWYRYTSTNTGRPVCFTIEGSNFLFGPTPDSAYTGKVLYYKTLDALATSAHGVFTSNPDLYLYESLCAAEPFLKNEKRVAMWRVMADEIINDLERQDRKAPGQIRIRDDYNPQ